MIPPEQTGRDAQSAVRAARAFVEQEFPDGLVAFVAGSAVHGRATATSDLDILVLRPGDGPAYKETFEAFGWPVVAFVITQTRKRRARNCSRASRKCALPPFRPCAWRASS